MPTKNFLMSKLGLERAEESEIQMLTFTVSRRKQWNSRKASTSVSSTTLKSLTVRIITNCGKLLRRWEYKSILPVTWETYMRATATEAIWKNLFIQDWERSKTGLSLFILFTLYSVHHEKLQAGIKIDGRNIKILRHVDDTMLMTESEEELKNLLWWWMKRVKERA